MTPSAIKNVPVRYVSNGESIRWQVTLKDELLPHQTIVWEKFKERKFGQCNSTGYCNNFGHGSHHFLLEMTNASIFKFTVDQAYCSDSGTHMYAVFNNGNDAPICRRLLANVEVEEKDITCTSIYQHTEQNLQLKCSALKHGYEVNSLQFLNHTGEIIEAGRNPTLGMGCRNQTITITDIVSLNGLFSDDGYPLYCTIDETKICNFSIKMEEYTFTEYFSKTQIIQFTCCSSDRDIPDIRWVALDESHRSEDRDEYDIKEFVILCGQDNGTDTLTFGVGRIVLESNSASVLFPISANVFSESYDRGKAYMESHCKYKHIINITMSNPFSQPESETIRSSKLVLHNDLPVCDHIFVKTMYYMSKEETGNSIKVQRGDSISIIGVIENTRFDDKLFAFLHHRDDKLSPCYLLPSGQCWNEMSNRHFLGVSNMSEHEINIEVNISALEFEDSGSYIFEMSLHKATHCRFVFINITVIEILPECSADYLNDSSEFRLSCRWHPLSTEDVVLLEHDNRTVYRSEHDVSTPTKTYFNTSKIITSDASLNEFFRQNRIPDKCTILQFGYEKSCQFYNFKETELMPTVKTTLGRNVGRITCPCCMDNEQSGNIWLYRKNEKRFYILNKSPKAFTESAIVNNELIFLCGKDMDEGLRLHTVIKVTFNLSNFFDTLVIDDALLELLVTPLTSTPLDYNHEYDIKFTVYNTESEVPLEGTEMYTSPKLSLPDCPIQINTCIPPVTNSIIRSNTMLRPVSETMLIAVSASAFLVAIFVQVKFCVFFTEFYQCSIAWKRRNTQNCSDPPQSTEFGTGI